MEEVTATFEKAIPIVNEGQRLNPETAALSKKEPSSRTMLPPSDEILDLYEQLRQAWRDEFSASAPDRAS
jgi:hypothetical protein